METELRKICKRMVKIEKNFETAPRVRRDMLLRTYAKLYSRLTTKISEKFPLLGYSVILKYTKDYGVWLQDRVTNRVGRVLQNPIPRTERRRERREQWTT